MKLWDRSIAGRKVWENIMLEGNGLNVSKGQTS